MNYLYTPLNYQEGGKTIEATISGTSCNVILLDSNNLAKYKSGKKFDYYGGHFNHSPALIHIPLCGIWHVVVDGGNAKVSIRIY